MFRTLLIILSLALLLPARGLAEPFRVEEVARGLGVPWGMAFVSRDELLVTERSGQLHLLKLADGIRIPVEGVPEVASGGQGGLLDIARAPDFAASQRLFFTYSKPTEEGAVTALATARFDGELTRLQEWRDLLVTRSATATSRHFGSRITFDDLGHLFFGVGDRGHRPNGQDLATHAGAILRLRLDGSAPADNPFAGSRNALPEIFSYGHRNPQGLVWDSRRRILWEIEHGPRGGDELNRILPGRNYGWPVVSFGKEYWGPFQVGEGSEKPGMEPPVKVWIPSIAPGSLLLYQGDAFPQWQGDLFAGALKLRHLNRIRLDKAGNVIGEERLLEGLNERIRALAESPEGWIYLSTDSGRILRLRP